MNLLLIVMASVSPGLNKKIIKFVTGLKEDAAEADNPLDKLFIGLLLNVFDIKD